MSWEHYFVLARGRCHGTDGLAAEAMRRGWWLQFALQPSAAVTHRQTGKVHQHSATSGVFMLGRPATLSITEFGSECEELRGFRRA
jgi:hypothetical protein